jgi:N-hydroxyarylamine O-acetyltransferase
MIDLDAYFARIGYAGARTPDLATLRAIHALHPAAIPFENLDPLLGRPVPLDLAALQRKLVGSRRGGYCFEQNTLLRAVLEALGFKVTSFTARVVWRVPPDRPPNPRAHMVLKVDLDDGAWLADVGFGGYLLAAPLRFVPDLEQDTVSGTLALRRDDFTCTLQLKVAGAWQDVYRFTLEPTFPIDQEVANWFTAAHPDSRFRNNLLMERLTPQVRISLFNTRLTRRYADGRMEEATLAGGDDLGRVLVADFGLEPPADPASVFARLPKPPPP